MLLPQFRYHDPTRLEEALQVMSTLKEKAAVIAGGTDVLVNIKKGVIRPEDVVSLGRIPELRTVSFNDGILKIGACVTASELTEYKEVNSEFHALSEGAESLGSPLIRNLATIGGNLVTARPAADFPPSLIAYEAKLVLRNSVRERLVSVDKFFVGPGETIREPDELLTVILIDRPPAHSGAHYMKLGMRKSLSISIVNVACYLALNEGGCIDLARIALGAVAPTPVRAKEAEICLMGEKASESLFRKAGELAIKDCRPIDDHRGSTEYRYAMVGVLTRRALTVAFKNAERNRSR